MGGHKDEARTGRSRRTGGLLTLFCTMQGDPCLINVSLLRCSDGNLLLLFLSSSRGPPSADLLLIASSCLGAARTCLLPDPFLLIFLLSLLPNTHGEIYS